MPSGRPLYEKNPATTEAGHGYEIERLKRRLAPPQNGVNPRIAFGQIDGSGSILDAGSGDWTVETDYAGTWTITFDPPFDAAPTLHLTVNETTTVVPASAFPYSRAVDAVVVKTYDGTGTLSDDIGFDFDAKGAEGVDDADS